MSQAVCPPEADASEFDSSEISTDTDSIRASIQSRWQNSPRIDVHHDRGFPVLDLGTKEIWDGSDLCLLRDTLVDLCQGAGHGGQGKSDTVGIEMGSVKGIPTGFFGMLHDLHVDLRVTVHLLSPQPNVCAMLWFRTFCEPEGESSFLMLRDPKPNVVPGAYHFWASLRGEDFVEMSATEFTAEA
ncbi:MAG TPA: hypothetical protein DIC23_18970 [Planctomycetaceae bacterium]|mgnify:FL=1|nr:hypothetical protein [Planctomycetaceae bacterium]|tara:strand:- start:915 stop:1469 length:555 start_codon:yes stop_codon:yes gene_type:complete